MQSLLRERWRGREEEINMSWIVVFVIESCRVDPFGTGDLINGIYIREWQY